MTVLVTHQKDQGRVRERQEDNCLSYVDSKKAILIVSDGMGGHAGGDLASQASVDAAQAVLEGWPKSDEEPPTEDTSPDLSDSASTRETEAEPLGQNQVIDTNRDTLPIPNFAVKVDEWIKSESGPDGVEIEIPNRDQIVVAIKKAFSQAQHAVCNVADMAKGLGSAGCTLTVAIIADGWLHIGHVGDSRSYIYRQGKLEQVTLDHSGAMLLVTAGLIKLEDARNHPESHSLYRFLGINALDLTVDVHHEKLQQDDLVLLCSDGLWGMLEDDHIADLLGKRLSLQKTGSILLDQANNMGGNDNISIAIAAMY